MVNKDITHFYFSPHFDDVVFSCAGLIAQQIKEGQSAVIITVFSAWPNRESLNAFSRHLQAKWRLSNKDAAMLRRNEDIRACQLLGAMYEHWDFLEAPCRKDKNGRCLYSSYDTLAGNPAPDDNVLKDLICQAIVSRAAKERQAGRVIRLYFPLGLGAHVDHQLLRGIAYEIQQKGHNVFYYEEWPYIADYVPDKQGIAQSWKAATHSIDINVKLNAALCYVSQTSGLGNSSGAMAKRLRQYAYQVGVSSPAERIWELSKIDEEEKTVMPFVAKRKTWTIRDFGRFVKILHWRKLSEVLPKGEGLCVDVGCGNGRLKKIIEECGYSWLGLDIFAPASLIKADAQHLPIALEKSACVVLWQVLEYLEVPEEAIRESARILEQGGVVCGSASFLEPVHGQTFYNVSPLFLEKLLRKYGFADIRIIPGLNGFSLLLWTWLKRYGGDTCAPLALFLAAIAMIPFALLRFLASWVFWRLGFGSGYGMEWITKTMPLEFAGHVIFVARKKI